MRYQHLYFLLSLWHSNEVYIDLRATSCIIEWSLFQVRSMKHARVIIFIMNLYHKAAIVALWPQRVNSYTMYKIKAIKQSSSIMTIFLLLVQFCGSLIHNYVFNYLYIYTCILKETIMLIMFNLITMQIRQYAILFAFMLDRTFVIWLPFHQ